MTEGDWLSQFLGEDWEAKGSPDEQAQLCIRELKASQGEAPDWNWLNGRFERLIKLLEEHELPRATLQNVIDDLPPSLWGTVTTVETRDLDAYGFKRTTRQELGLDFAYALANARLRFFDADPNPIAEQSLGVILEPPDAPSQAVLEDVLDEGGNPSEIHQKLMEPLTRAIEQLRETVRSQRLSECSLDRVVQDLPEELAFGDWIQTTTFELSDVIASASAQLERRRKS